MFYTLTKYLTSDYFRENEFTKAFLELVDEVIFCCYMESREMLSQLSFETMDDNYFLTFQDFFLNGLSSFDIKNLDRNVLSEWFSLLHVRGELSDLSKLLKFGGSLTTIQTNNKLTLYNNADVPETITNIGVDGVIYAVTDENVNLTEDFFINQQTPAGYKFNLIRQPAPFDLVSSDSIEYLLEKNNNIFVIDYGSIDLTKEKSSEFEFYRRRQFDQTYSFKQLYQSGYTINELSKFHKKGDFFFGFDVEIFEPESDVFPAGGLISDDNDILFEYPYGAPVSIGNYNYSVGNLKNVIIENGGIVSVGNYIYSVGNLLSFVIKDGGLVEEWQPPVITGIPMGGMISPTGHSTYYVQELPEQIIVDNITLSGRIIPTSSLEEYFGNDQLEPESITINDNDVIIPLYNFDVPVTDQSKLYGVMQLNGTGSGTISEIVYPQGGILTATSDQVILVPVEQAGGVVEVYAPPVVLPTVSMSGFIMPGHAVTINAGSTSTGWYVGSTGQPFVYESTKSYGARRALDAMGGNDIDPTVFALVDSSGELAVKNISNSSVNVEVIYVSVCSSNLATVITVYDSSNNPYNAFQYTSDGTDYYYVLDGTQTDWTDDLGSIGYHVPHPVYTAYFHRDESPIGLQPNFWFPLYKDGSEVVGEITKIYTPIALLDSSENVIQFNMSAAKMNVDDSTHCLKFSYKGDEQPQGVKYITYTVS